MQEIRIISGEQIAPSLDMVSGVNGSNCDGSEKCVEKSKIKVIKCQTGSNLLKVLQEHEIFLPAPCGGKGSCGKCKILVTKGDLSVTAEDKRVLSLEEIKSGMRLACKAVVHSDVTVCVSHASENEFTVLGSGIESLKENVSSQESFYGVAIDIGTTTIAMSLVGLSEGQVIDTYTCINRQRSFGADVITRIQAANNGSGERLRELIREDILGGIKHLLTTNDIAYAKMQKVSIAANTTMLHLLRGYSCEGLGTHPFTPVTLAQETLSFREVFGEDIPAEVTLLPGISVFVGADIVAGLYQENFYQKNTGTMFIDLGTNGEMALRTKDGIFVTSVAAGPALEGGNIKWGMGSIPGAISQVTIRQGKPKIRTIGEKMPEGICGTGVLEAVAELFNAEIMDETGKLAEPYFYSGYPLAKNSLGEDIALTQQDIREIQMAKGAIRAGIEVLLLRAGISYEEVEEICLAGGFGYYLNVEKAQTIGIFPNEFSGRIKASGNTALKGAIRFLTHPEDVKSLQILIEKSEEISIAETSEFQELYLKYMGFGACSYHG